MKKLEVNINFSGHYITVQVSVEDNATEQEIKTAAINQILSELPNSSLYSYEEVGEPVKDRWLVLHNGSTWTNLLKSEEECVEHINESISDFPEYSKDEFGYRLMTSEEVSRTGFRV